MTHNFRFGLRTAKTHAQVADSARRAEDQGIDVLTCPTTEEFAKVTAELR